MKSVVKPSSLLLACLLLTSNWSEAEARSILEPISYLGLDLCSDSPSPELGVQPRMNPGDSLRQELQWAFTPRSHNDSPYVFEDTYTGPTWTEASSIFGLNTNGTKFGGFSFYDFDSDGDLDLLLNTNDGTIKSVLYEQTSSGIFSNITASIAPGLQGAKMERSAVWGDLNNDGALDFVRNTSYGADGSIEIYFQDPVSGVFGNGTGGSVPIAASGLLDKEIDIYNGANSEGLGLADFDGDGDLDIIFDNHDHGIDILRNSVIDHTTSLPTGVSNTLAFTHATPGTTTALGLSQTAVDGDFGAFVDINDDGWIDVFMRKQNENDFFINVGGTYSNGQDLGQANNSSKGSNAIYDFDNDGDFDVFWTENGPNEIFRNDFGTWTPLGSGGTTGIPTVLSTKINEAAGGDYDNDGDIDLLLVGSSRSFLYENLLNDPVLGPDTGSPMTFQLVSTETFTSGQAAFGSLFVDLDDDGDLDIYFNRSGQNYLYLNGLYSAATPADDRELLNVRIWDNRSEYMPSGKERPALGATVILTDCDGVVLSGLREVSGGNSRGMQNPHDVHFGLPYGRNYNYQIVVKYPIYRQPDGTEVRKVIRKNYNPATSASANPLVEFRPDDLDVDCPPLLEICNNSIDDDGDGDIDCEDSDCSGMGVNHRITQSNQ